jgi:hypothetical protein
MTRNGSSRWRWLRCSSGRVLPIEAPGGASIAAGGRALLWGSGARR